jgi:hypothetical protein
VAQVLRRGVGVTRLGLARAGILGHRRRTGLLDHRAAWSDDAVRRAAWAGLTDSMPRAAQLSLHARLANVTDDCWEDAAFVQVWGPRYSVYVVRASDVAVFTRGRLPADGAARARADDIASRLASVLGGEPGDVREAAAALDIHHNAIRYAATTGTLRIRWDGARQPALWRVEAPDTDDDEMRRELARRYLHVVGPSTPRPAASGPAYDRASRKQCSTTSPTSSSRSRRRLVMAGSWQPTSHHSVRSRIHRRLPDCCPAVTATGCPGERTGTYSWRTPPTATCCGRHACGRAR